METVVFFLPWDIQDADDGGGGGAFGWWLSSENSGWMPLKVPEK